MPAAFRLKGALDIAALKKCFSEILRRHEVLRTRFIAADDEALQVIQAAPDFELSVIDLASLAPSSREAEALRLAHEEAAKPFSLSCGPVFRAHLVKLAADDHVLTINLHHIVSDNWSMVVLYRELGALYDEYTTGGESQLAELSIQYADYALWQRERLKGRVLDEQLTYWKAQLKGAPALLELPIDRPRPQTQKYHGAHQTHMLARSLLDDLKALSQANGATLFMTLLTAFKLLLARYTGAQDILVGAPVAGRTRAETESLIGFFVNTLVLRTDCSNDPSFTDLLARVRATCLSAYAHQDIPFEKLVEELKPERSLSYAPLVQVMFGQRNADARKLALHGLDVTRIELARESATFDLYMGVTETDDGLHLSIEYNIDLFEHPTITRLIGHYEALLDGIVAD
ncbi:MAG: condensation domain-containing protein, partial [Burkholderiales bacterium]